jgi:sulfur transfer complex TusBCD TusB component (DsrH family)
MTTLHLVAFPPSRTDLLAQVSACLGEQDEVVLLEAGVFIASDAAACATFAGARCYVLQYEHVHLAEGMVAIDWAALIALTESHPRCLSWWP